MSTANPDSTVAGGDGRASTVSAEMVTGWHVLKVENYSKIKGLAAGGSVRSGAFDVGGHSWCIKFFPGGCHGLFGVKSADCISVSLYLNHPAANSDCAMALTRFSLLDQTEESGQSYTLGDMHIQTYSSQSPERGYEDFMKRVDFESSPYLRDDSFQIRCDVTVLREICTCAEVEPEPTAVEPITQVASSPDLHRHLGELLTSEEGGDVTFEVGGETFAAHKCILAARSSVFKAELFGPMKEEATDYLRIEDMAPKVFKSLLDFIYTDLLMEMDPEEDKVAMSQQLLVAADRYNIERLKLICEDVLSKDINTDVAATTLVLAEQHGCHGLKEACFKYLKSPGNLNAVMATDGFQHLKNSCPSLLEELLTMVAP